MNELDDNINGVMVAYKKAVFAKNVDAFMTLYDPQVCVFDMWGQWSYDGADAWRAMVTGWFASLEQSNVVVNFEQVCIIATADVAVVHAMVVYTGVSALGEELCAMHNRLTWTLKPTGNGWRIVHEHTSAPVDFETSKAILQRPEA